MNGNIENMRDRREERRGIGEEEMEKEETMTAETDFLKLTLKYTLIMLVNTGDGIFVA